MSDSSKRPLGFRRPHPPTESAVRKAHLSNEVERLMKRCFIGAIASFELHFGVHLWGHGFSEPMDESQEAWSKVWAKCREEIFDKGHDQIGRARIAIDQHEISQAEERLDNPPGLATSGKTRSNVEEN